jgi:AcrR family transcriptional regulator
MTQRESTNRRERKKAATRERIVRAAAALFKQNGYQSTSIEDITEAADVAPRTFYSYFGAKVDVALVQFEQWVDDLHAAMEARPVGETPEEMFVGTLEALHRQGYVTGQRLRDAAGHPFPPLAVGVLLAETEPEVAGRIYQTLVRHQGQMTDLFRERLGYPRGAIEPRTIAAAITASWFVAVHGFSEVSELDPDPPSTDELATQSFHRYSTGMAELWKKRPETT